MKTDFEKFLSRTFQVLHEMTQQMGAAAWVALGIVLVVLAVIGILVLRWVRLRGLADGAVRRFFADRRRLLHWLRHR